MRQAFHIFKKDVRYLWYEITVTLALVVVFAFADSHSWRESGRWDLDLKPFLPVAWVFLIERVFHAEVLPGDRQFWLTRPYSRMSLILAKTMFILIFVTFPTLAADDAILKGQAFPVSSNLSGLLWEQVLCFASIAIPAAAFASLSAGLVGFVLSGLICVVAIVLPGTLLPQHSSGPGWGGLGWVGLSISQGLFVTAALVIVTSQYARRNRLISSAAGAAILLLGFAAIPAEPPFSLLSRFSSVRTQNIHVVLDLRKINPQTTDFPRQDAQLLIPIQFTELLAGMEVRGEGAFVKINLPGGGVWHTEQGRPFHSANLSARGDAYELTISMAPEIYQQIKDQPVRIRASLNLTLLGNLRNVATIPSQSGPIAIPGLGWCGSGLNSQGVIVSCRRPLRSPRFVTWIESRDERRRALFDPDYSPYSAQLGISPIVEAFAVERNPSGGGVTFVTEEPLAFLRQDFEIPDLRLRDFIVLTR